MVQEAHTDRREETICHPAGTTGTNSCEERKGHPKRKPRAAREAEGAGSPQRHRPALTAGLAWDKGGSFTASGHWSPSLIPRLNSVCEAVLTQTWEAEGWRTAGSRSFLSLPPSSAISLYSFSLKTSEPKRLLHCFSSRRVSIFPKAPDATVLPSHSRILTHILKKINQKNLGILGYKSLDGFFGTSPHSLLKKVAPHLPTQLSK